MKLKEYSVIILLVFLLSVVVLAACNESAMQQPTQIATQIETPTSQPILVVSPMEESTATLAPTVLANLATNTPTIEATKTANPSPTETAIPQPSETRVPTDTPTPEPSPTTDLSSAAVWSEKFSIIASFPTGAFEWSPVADEAIFLDCLDVLDSGSEIALVTFPDFEKSVLPLEISESLSCSGFGISWRPNGEHFLFATGDFGAFGDLWFAHKSDGLIEKLDELLRLPSVNWLSNDEVALNSYNGGGEYESKLINVSSFQVTGEEYFVPNSETDTQKGQTEVQRLSENFVLIENHAICNLQTNEKSNIFQNVPDGYDFDRIAISTSERYLSIRECNETALFDCKTHIVEILKP